MTFKKFLILLFDKLNKANINACVLRNYDLFPEKNLGNDIDFLINKNDVDKFIKILRKIDQMVITNITKRKYVFSIFVWNIKIKDNNALQLDLVTDLSWKGIPYLNNNVVFASMEKVILENGVFYLKPDITIEAIISLFASYMVGGWIKERYKKKVLLGFLSNKEEIQKILDHKYGKKNSTYLIECVQNWDTVKLLSFRRKFIMSLLKKTIKHRGLFSVLKNIFLHFYHEIRIRVSSQTYYDITILGPDGVGKSQTIHEIISQLQNTTKILEYRHLKPRIFKKDIKNDNQSYTICTEPHAYKSRGCLMSIIKITLWVLEMWLDVLFNRPKNSTVRIWDRYFYDIFIDPKRYRYGASFKIAKLFGKLVPKPDKIIVLTAPTDIIQQRKQEVTKKETTRQVKGYKKFARETDALLIDTSKPIEETSKLAVESIINDLTKRVDYNG